MVSPVFEDQNLVFNGGHAGKITTLAAPLGHAFDAQTEFR